MNYSFNFQPASQGRFALIRKLNLAFTVEGYMRTLQTGTGRLLAPRAQIMHEWARFFTLNKYEDRSYYIRFPALESLTLDFSDWDLQPGEGIMVSRSLNSTPSHGVQWHKIQRLASRCLPARTH